jgi:hypothetical protein
VWHSWSRMLDAWGQVPRGASWAPALHSAPSLWHSWTLCAHDCRCGHDCHARACCLKFAGCHVLRLQLSSADA